MERIIIAGIDGSAESLDAADWAAREALRRGLPLLLLHAGDAPETHTGLPELDAPADRTGHALERAARALASAHPALEISRRQAAGPPDAALLDTAASSECVVLGSRGFAGFAGFLVGSVALAVAAGAACPVVLVRAGARAEDEHWDSAAGPYRPVVLGIDLDHPCDELIDYAFEAARARRAPLHVLHTWAFPLAPSGSAVDPEEEQLHHLAAMLNPWRHKYADTEVSERTVHGRATHHLLLASTRASLLIVGRRIPSGPRLGPVAHSMIHHSLCPLAVVPHV
ncbi:universal stress protein [Streptomyces xanthochromogenes]|uniref:Stress-inducible protein n=1 Tax=Streptomyces xanthochromogenes TaxID=67384 RepID=A0ABQ2ZJT7_9ACTN|nr:universal stress protein [Streptomyces xanthochromogenes]GGY15190.1 stress-inducible protein [Streptomyces xanthochromogenes]